MSPQGGYRPGAGRKRKPEEEKYRSLRLTVHIPLKDATERELVEFLTPEERRAVLLEAARAKQVKEGEPRAE